MLGNNLLGFLLLGNPSTVEELFEKYEHEDDEEEDEHEDDEEGVAGKERRA